MYYQRKRQSYKCPDCGANLDPGEPCDCQNKNNISVTPETPHKASKDTIWDFMAGRPLTPMGVTPTFKVINGSRKVPKDIKKVTTEQAKRAYDLGYAFEVNDGRDVVLNRDRVSERGHSGELVSNTP